MEISVLLHISHPTFQMLGLYIILGQKFKNSQKCTETPGWHIQVDRMLGQKKQEENKTTIEELPSQGFYFHTVKLATYLLTLI